MSVRYQVFISSTYNDLREERQEILSALLQLDAIPAGMELFPAADEAAWDLIERFIRECDYYLLVIGGRYGATDDDGLSYTEREFDLAVEIGLPIMAFIHADPDRIESGKTDQNDELSASLESFKTKVQDSKHVKFWHSKDELAGLVALTYTYFTKNYSAIGWIRADTAASSDAINEINALRKENDRLSKEFKAQILSPPKGSEKLASGHSLHTLTINSSAYLESPYPTNSDGMRPPSKFVERSIELNITWNEVLEVVGPLMFDEASEPQLIQALNSYLKENYSFAVELHLAAIVRKNGFNWESNQNPAFFRVIFSITQSSFHTILVQFKALGVITNSTKNRSVKDKSTYWSLTPLGDLQVTGLIAIKGHDSPTNSDDDGSGFASTETSNLVE